ncbi:MAG: oligosaccharide flippase family protein [Thermodesulfobacteriota bacterium]
MPNASFEELSFPDSSSYTMRFAQGAFWSLIATMGTRLFTFAANIFVARVLGKEGFGELAIILSTVAMLGTFSGLGIGMTATKYVAELRLQDPERAGRIIGLTYLVSWIAGGLMAMFCLLAAPWLAMRTLNAPHLIPELQIASLEVLISTGFAPQVGILSGLQAFRALARINWYQGLLSLPINVVLVLVAGLRGVIVALILVTAIEALLSVMYLRKECLSNKVRPDFRRAWQERAILWRFSLPAFLTNTINTPVIWAAYAILANQPNGYAELGLFNAASQFNLLITGLNTILATVSVPLLAEVYGKEQRERFALFFNTNFRFNWGLCIAFGFVAVIISPWLIRFFGVGYQGALPILQLNISFMIVYVGCALTGQAFYSSGKMWLALLVTVFWATVLLSCETFIAPLYGALGLSISMLIAYCLVFVGQIALLMYLFGSSVAKDIHILSLLYFILMLHVILSVGSYNNILINFFIYLAFLITGYNFFKRNLDLFQKILQALRAFWANGRFSNA